MSKRRPTQLVAMRIVRAYLADLGGADREDREGLGWGYGPHERRLALAIETAILGERERIARLFDTDAPNAEGEWRTVQSETSKAIREST